MSIAKNVAMIPTNWSSKKIHLVSIEFMLVMVLSDRVIQEIWEEAFDKYMIL